MISVRHARPDDQSFISELGRETALDTISAIRKISPDTAIQSFQRLLDFCRERFGSVTFIAEQDGHRGGFLILLTDVPDDPTQLPQGFIAYVAVEPHRRGQGLGRALLRAAEFEAQQRHLPHLSLMVSSHNRARSLYEREGFQDERTLMTKILALATA